MVGKVKHQLLNLIHNKEKELGRRLTVKEIADGTHVSQKLIYRWLDPKHPPKRYDEKTITAFCDYFGVAVGDLLVYEVEAE